MESLSQQPKLLASEHDIHTEHVFSTLHNSNIRTIVPEIIFGKIFDKIGFGQINEDLFRHLVIARLATVKQRVLALLNNFHNLLLITTQSPWYRMSNSQFSPERSDLNEVKA